MLPALQVELDNVRKMLSRVPDGKNEFKPHVKSYRLSELAGHLVEMPMFVQLALTSPDVDLGANGFVPLVMESRQRVVSAFDEHAGKLVAFISQERCELLWDGHVVFKRTRYDAYRSLGMNHLLHHRAQLGVYLRLLGEPVRASPYGPSVDSLDHD